MNAALHAPRNTKPATCAICRDCTALLNAVLLLAAALIAVATAAKLSFTSDAFAGAPEENVCGMATEAARIAGAIRHMAATASHARKSLQLLSSMQHYPSGQRPTAATAKVA